ncbi:MAG: acyl-CoA dehydrogenase [Pelistega sp.]|nr:acyl-CoA dehydrogenase [Pelistega sp.]
MSSIASTLIDRDDLAFILFDVLNIEQLTQRDRYSDHSKETFISAIDTAEKIATELFLPHNRYADENEPKFDGQSVQIIEEVKQAILAFAQAGFLSATHDYELDGMQLPITVAQSCLALFRSANIATSAYCFLTAANANLIRTYGSEQQKQRYLPNLLQGKWLGTMAITEPHAGSSVPDLHTTAYPQADGSYLLKGQKIFISAGDHNLSENIVHLVLARIAGAPAGAKGLSLFLVPKYRVDAHGQVSERNDVLLSGLIHKMGYRGTTSTILSFGEYEACYGELIGEAGKGLNCMFHMMNEARIGVGMGGTMLGYTAYLHSINYAKERTQGRPIDNKDSSQSQVPIIQHADIRRMLMTQKAYVEGALLLCLYAAWLADESKTQTDHEAKAQASLLLSLLTPIVKTWPAQYCLEANSLAIQIHGGYGYTREYPVEQFYRDNRLNPIHEGTHGIQSLDLLLRKVNLADGSALTLLHSRVTASIEQTLAQADTHELHSLAKTLQEAWSELIETSHMLTNWGKQDISQASANSFTYLDAFGHHTMAWLWLMQANVAHSKLNAQEESSSKSPPLSAQQVDFYQAKLRTCQWFFHTELPLARTKLMQLNNRKINHLLSEPWPTY